MPKNNSDISLWNFFEKSSDGDKTAICNYCRRKLAYKTTITNLKSHLKQKHISAYNNLLNYGKNIVPSAKIINKNPKNTDVPVWNFFEKSGDKKTAICNYCRRELSYKTTTTNLKKHLKRKHISSYNNFLNYGDNLESTVVNETVSHVRGIGGKTTTDNNGGDSQGDVGGSTAKKPSNKDGVIEPPEKNRKVMHAHLTKKVKPENSKKIDLCLLKMIVYDFQPFSIVEDVGFRTYTHALNPNYEIPDRKTLSGNLLSYVYHNRLEQIKSYVEANAKSVCITIDCWTSHTMDSYMAITAHFIADDSLKSILIQCDQFEGHTDFGLYREIKSTLLKWNIYNKVNFVVSDNASNMESAARYFEADGWSHFECLAHKLNLVIQDALDDIRDTLMKVYQIVNHFRKSTIAKEKLLEFQMNQQNIAQPKTVIKSVATMWNSVYLMLLRFVELKEALRATIPYLDVDLPIISMEEWKSIEQICVVLKPFYEATKEMSAESYLVASKAIVLTSSLINICHNYSQVQDLCSPVKTLAQKLKSGMIQRLGDIESNVTISLSTLLDPRFKLKAIKKEENKVLLKTTLLNKMVQELDIKQQVHLQNTGPRPYTSSAPEVAPAQLNIIDDSSAILNYKLEFEVEDNIVFSLDPTPSTTSSPVAAPDELNSSAIPNYKLWNEFDLEANIDYSPKPSHEKAAEELERYLADSLIKRNECPFKWWREHKCVYPTLFELFSQICNIIVTAVPCERFFSKSGYIISERRTRLSSTKVAQIMFLNVNKM